MSVFEPCPFSKLLRQETNPGVHCGVIPRDLFVGGLLLEVDGDLMGDPILEYRESMERLRENISSLGNGVV